MNDYFWGQVEKNIAEAEIPFELTSSSSGEAIPRDHQTPFMDHMGGDGILVNLRLVLRMRVEKGEVCCSDINFEAKSQTNLSFAKWATELVTHRVYSDSILSAGIGGP